MCLFLSKNRARPSSVIKQFSFFTFRFPRNFSIYYMNTQLKFTGDFATHYEVQVEGINDVTQFHKSLSLFLSLSVLTAIFQVNLG